MDKYIFMKLRACAAHAGRRWRSVSMLFLLSGLLGCSQLQPLADAGDRPSRGWWLELRDERTQTISPGVILELPDAPYRARFADEDGVYFQASLPLIFRNAHGLRTEHEGGLYVRNGRSDQAQVWFSPIIGDPLRPEERPVLVEIFRP